MRNLVLKLLGAELALHFEKLQGFSMKGRRKTEIEGYLRGLFIGY